MKGLLTASFYQIFGKKVNIFNLDQDVVLKKPKDIGFLLYIKVLACNLIGGKFNSKTSSGKKLDQIKKKLIVADKVRDFNFILLKMNEVENLKNIFLNDHQSLSMYYLQKPKNIVSNNTPHRFSFLVNSEEKNALYLKQYFVKRMETGGLSGNDEVLFNQLNDKIKSQILSHVSRK